jgi:hypothetical protein
MCYLIRGVCQTKERESEVGVRVVKLEMHLFGSPSITIVLSLHNSQGRVSPVLLFWAVCIQHIPM